MAPLGWAHYWLLVVYSRATLPSATTSGHEVSWNVTPCSIILLAENTLNKWFLPDCREHFLLSEASSVRTITRMMQLRLLDVKKNFAAWVIKEVTKTKRKAHQQERRRGGLLTAIVAFCETPKLDIKWRVWLFTDLTALLLVFKMHLVSKQWTYRKRLLYCYTDFSLWWQY